MSFYFYMLMLLFNFNLMSIGFGNFMSVIGASDKIMEIMDEKQNINTKGGTILPECHGKIELRNVKFCYPSKKEVEVLKGISIEVCCQKNRVIALCGTSGCGKSSVIGMVERFYDPTEG